MGLEAQWGEMKAGQLKSFYTFCKHNTSFFLNMCINVHVIV